MDHLQGHRGINRRELMRGTAAGALALAIPDAAFAQASSKLRIAVTAFKNESMDPVDGHPDKLLRAPIFDYLVGLNAASTDVSKDTGLARDWEQSADGKRWTFTIRDGVAWQKGNGVVSAQDVAFSLARITGPDSTSATQRYFRNIADIKAEGNTVTLGLQNRAVDLPHMLSALRAPEGMIIPKAYFEKVGRDGFRQNPVGSGPYELVSRSAGRNVVFRSVGKHWELGTPRYAELELLQVPEETTRVAMLRKGDVNLIDVPRRMSKELGGDANIAIRARSSDATFTLWFAAQESPTPFDKVEVRTAMSMAIDRSQLPEIFGGPALAKVPTNPGVCGSYNKYCGTFANDAYNPDQARKLLQQAGGGFDLNIFVHRLFPEQQDLSESLAGFWEAIGLRPKIMPMDFAAFRALAFQKKLPPNSTLVNEVPNSLISAVNLLSFYGKGSPPAHRWTPELEALYVEMSDAPTFEDQGKIIEKASKIIFEGRFEIPLIEAGQVLAFDKSVRLGNTDGRQYYDFGIRDVLRS